MTVSTSTPATGIDVRRTLSRNTRWNYLGFAVNLVANLLLLPFVVGRVGDALAGVWLLLGSVTGYMGLLELGLVPALTQLVAGALGRGTPRDVSRAASTALALLVGLAALALQLLWLVPDLVDLLRIPPELTAESRTILAISIAGFALRMPLATLQALLLGCQRQDRCSQLWVAIATVKAAATVALLLAGRGIVAVVLMEALVHLLAGGLQAHWVRRELPELRLGRRHVTGADAKALLGLGGALLLANLCTLVIERTDRVVIAAFRPIDEVTYYSAAFKLYMLAVTVPTVLVYAVAPLAGHLHGSGEHEALGRLFVRMTKYSAALAVLLVAGLVFSSGALLRLWMGERFVEARHVVQVLGAGLLVTAFNHTGYSALVGKRRIAPLLWRYFLPQAALNLVLSLALVSRFGSVGVALGTAIPALLLEAPFLAFVLRELGVSWRRFLAQTVAPVLVPAAPAFAPLAALAAAAPPDSPVLIVAAAASCALYAGLFWVASLDPGERADLLGVVLRGRGLSPARSA